MRDSFVFYRSFFESIELCPEDAQLSLYRAVARYALDQEGPSFEGAKNQKFLTAIWAGMRPQLDANMKRYINGCKGAEFGKLGGNPNFEKGKPNPYYKDNPKDNPKITPNENDNDNENENVNVSTNTHFDLELPFNTREFVSTWDELRQQPKWRHKTQSALQRCLNQLGKYDLQFAIELMGTAIANGNQGVVYPQTDQHYKQWLMNNRHPQGGQKAITSIDELY